MDSPKPTISFQPYLLRAMYEWISDNGFSPQIDIDIKWPGVVVPQKFTDQGSLILNISSSATHKLRIGNDVMEFDTKFGAIIYHIILPIGSIRSIFARENNCGTVFSPEMRSQETTFDNNDQDQIATKNTKPKLRVISKKSTAKDQDSPDKPN